MFNTNKNMPELHTAEDGGLRVTGSGAHINARREQWLCKIAEALLPVFEKQGFGKHPVVRIGVGFPTTGARGKAVGQCHNASASKDRVHEITISPKLDDTDEVAGVVAHELCHAYLQSSFPEGILRPRQEVQEACGRNRTDRFDALHCPRRVV